MNINMNLNKDGIKELQKKFNEITEISKKYSNMGYKKSQTINYRKPLTKEEEIFVKKANIKSFALLLFITIVFIITLVASIISGTSMWVEILLGIIVLICIIVTVKSITTTELFVGKAIYKERERQSSKGKVTYRYYVSITDEENKLIYTRIQVSKSDYEVIEEGTVILVSKGTRSGYIYE